MEQKVGACMEGGRDMGWSLLPARSVPICFALLKAIKESCLLARFSWGLGPHHLQAWGYLGVVGPKGPDFIRLLWSLFVSIFHCSRK